MLIDGLPLEAPAAPLNDLLRAGLESTPEAPALVSAQRSISWRELDEESRRLAGGYREMGLEPGDRVASLMPNRIALLVHYLACFKTGLVATPLNPTGKIDRVGLKRMAEGHLHPHGLD